jgi:hypothetical protein
MIRAASPTTTSTATATSANLPRWRDGWIDRKTGKPCLGFWYCWADKKQVNLSKFGAPRTNKNKADYNLALEARAKWLDGVQAGQQAAAIRAAAPATVYEVCNLFVTHRLPQCSVSYQFQAKRHLENFCKGEPGRLWKAGQRLNAKSVEIGGRRYAIAPYAGFGNLPASELNEHHVAKWCAAHPNWGKTGTRNALVVLKAAFNFALRHPDESGRMLIEKNPLAVLAVPQTAKREEVLSAEQHAVLRAKVSPAFTDFFDALWGLGCRPGELAAVRKSHFNAKTGQWILPPSCWKNGKKTGRSRYITLPDKWIAWTEERIAGMYEDENGLLFRNAWNVGCSMNWCWIPRPSCPCG